MDVEIEQNPGYGGAHGFIIEAGLDQGIQVQEDPMANAEKLVLIKRIMIDLEYVWTQNPDLRLGQLMENLYGCGICMYAREDQLISTTLRQARDKGLVAIAKEIDSDVGK